MSQEQASTLLIQYDGIRPTTKDLKEALEKGDVAAKIDAVKKMTLMQLSGESQSPLIMSVIKYCVPQPDHTLKKVLLYFWESIEKTDSNGKLLSEMILLCSFLRADLQHSNEYVRGVTLRFLTKLKEKDIMEPLVSAVVQNLTHRITFVRRNAVLAIQNIYVRFPELLPNAPELVETFLNDENDVSAKRNAFNMLFTCAQERAVRYLMNFRESHDMSEMGDHFQLAVVDLVKQLIKSNPYEKGRYVPILFATLQSKSPAVLYQCASTLLTLTTSPTAIKQAANTFIQVLGTHSDNNVRLIVLDRLDEMKTNFAPILEESIMDLLRSLSNGNMDIRRRIINLSMELVSAKSCESYVSFMKKELVRSQSEDVGDADAQQEYRQELVKAIHKTVMTYTSVAAGVVPIMLDYICEPGASSYDVIVFIREVMAAQPELREDLLTRMASLFPMIASPKVLRAVMWLFGVHATTVEQIANIFEQLKEALHPLPLTPPVASTRKNDNDDGPSTVATTTVREDGTYVMSIEMVSKRAEKERSDLQGIRSQIASGDYFLATAFANTVAKLVVQIFKSHAPSNLKNTMQVDASEMLHELIRYGTSRVTTVMDDDCHERIRLALTLSQNPTNTFVQSMVEDSIAAFEAARNLAAANEKKDSDDSQEVVLGLVDQPILFTQLSTAKQSAIELTAVDDIGAAVSNETLDKDSDFLAKLQRVVPLSGYSDPVYAEAAITVHPFDVLVELFVVNQTTETLQNLTVELSTIGDLKLCENPQTYVLPPGGSQKIRSNIKVCSTEAGVIYGNIIYDTHSSDRNCVILNEIRLDIMDYIKPALCSNNEFRSMWAAFEWENKVLVQTDITDPRTYAEHIMKITNTNALDDTPDADACGYLSLKLYARSVFGEDALANVSVERTEDGKLEGVVRIRTKTQGMALGLGDIVSIKQKHLIPN